MPERARTVAVLAFLALQVVGLARARFVDDRYFAWAPLHEVAEVRVEVEGGPTPSLRELASRYAVPDSAVTSDGFRELNALAPLLERIRRIECASPHPRTLRLEVVVDGRPRMETIRCLR